MKNKIIGVLSVFALTAGLHAQSVSTVFNTGLLEPHSVAVDPTNAVYVTDGAHHRIIKYVPNSGAVSVLAGTGQIGTNNGTQARFYQPQGIIYARGGLVVADSANHLLRYITLNGVVSNLAGVYNSTGLSNGPAASAHFRYPTGLASDAAGNIYIADSQNNAIRMLDTNNIVSTVATGFWQPAAVAVGANGDLWVTDTRRHMIKRVYANGGGWSVEDIAGAANVPGSDDGSVATEARFNSPKGLLWQNGQLIITDSGNHLIRRLVFNNELPVPAYQVETLAGIPNQAGTQDGDLTTGTFNAPIGLARDTVNDALYVVDNGGNALRRLQTTQPLPPVSAPVFGVVDFVVDPVTLLLVSEFTPQEQGIFDGPNIVAVNTEPGTITYITFGPTQSSIPTPGPNTGSTPQSYKGDGLTPDATAPTIIPIMPDITVKAVSMQEGRRSSPVVTARYQYKVSNPEILGQNPASLTFAVASSGAAIYYTLDGSEPTNNGASFGPVSDGTSLSLVITNDIVMKARAYLENFKPSDIVLKSLSPTNFAANRISFGFEHGEASSDFIAAAGQRFFAPVTLNLIPGQRIYSLQFNVTVTNLLGSPGITPGAFGFQSMLEKPIPATKPQLYAIIPPQMFVGVDTNLNPIFQDLFFGNTTNNLLGIGWLERYEYNWLYDTKQQDLITYSQVHDKRYLSSEGKVVLGCYSFSVPMTATNGQKYQIQIGRASGTEDGISKGAYIEMPTNGAPARGTINSIKEVTVGSARYIVGDIAPFRWFNAGDFGDTNILNNDILQIFESVVYSNSEAVVFMGPPQGSDFFDGMDASDGTSNNLFNGDDTDINAIQFGDGKLEVDDIFVSFRRALDPSLAWYARYWSNGVRQVERATNSISLSSMPKLAKAPQKARLTSSGPHAVTVKLDSFEAAPGQTVQIPVVARVVGDAPIRVLSLNLAVVPLDGSPALTNTIQFSASPSLGSPGMSSSFGSNNFAAAWLNSSVTGVQGTNLIGVLSVTLPANATSQSAYLVKLSHFSASPNGLAVFPAVLQDGMITLCNRESSSWQDEIPDSWRLKFFGSVSNLLSAAQLDADADGVSNWMEFKAGSNPMDARSKLSLLTGGPVDTSRFMLQWPTALDKKYVIECAPSLFGTNWTVVASNIVGNGLLQQFSDTNVAGPAKFYRVRLQ